MPLVPAGPSSRVAALALCALAPLVLGLGGSAPAHGADPVTGVPMVMCDGVPATIVGTEGDDFLEGGEGRDVIAGLGGHDFVYAYGGDDLVCGGTERDAIYCYDGADVLYGGQGQGVARRRHRRLAPVRAVRLRARDHA